jgi:hypothetical protein
VICPGAKGIFSLFTPAGRFGKVDEDVPHWSVTVQAELQNAAAQR